MIDLFVVSVLLDAGAGDKWKYKEPNSGETYTRSEGIAVASLYMFLAGEFSTTESVGHVVDGMSCCLLRVEVIGKADDALQPKDSNVSPKRHSQKAFRSLLRTL